MRLLAVRMVKLGETRTSVGEFIRKDRKTIGNWVKDYDKYGIEGLIPDYSSCGTKSKLTNDQLVELKILLSDPDKHYTIIDAKELIENRFGVTYSYKQVWEITRKKLGFNYCKPFLIYKEAPADAEDILLKKHPGWILKLKMLLSLMNPDAKIQQTLPEDYIIQYLRVK